MLLKCNYDVKDLNSNLNGFYLHLLIWWVNCAHCVIWNNKYIRIDNKPIFFKKNMQIVELFM